MNFMPLVALALVALAPPPPPETRIVEPKEIKGPAGLKSGEGVLRLSLRSQRQFIETAYLYLVEVRPDGADGPLVLRFERGAGVPVMGTNMIDVKARYYRVPRGRYRLLAYTVACNTVPPPGTACLFGARALPTEAYVGGSPTLEVAEGAVTDGGDFVIEYTKEVDLDKVDLFDDSFSDEGYGVRWRAIKPAIAPPFAALRAGPAPVVPPEFRSRIECEQRPKSMKIQFPFRCPATN
ncbi:hypothetical protein [Sphingomonas sp.]|uniref:hypothetical protein n=1 Tax=Sphingomonas sp. TaxID=28214 RepID=UPI001B141A31|nr:hypothetical protein [Sphingomonas sp.]MBO9712942.1 hypothetical protein [Sphingomonas sp.]